ncbi:hypothetical protein IKG13_00375 [Candidatus Saccharibacteria bacterium]|nr:hypothetical protein [Candidatus Saccharibacteria bacterium]
MGIKDGIRGGLGSAKDRLEGLHNKEEMTDEEKLRISEAAKIMAEANSRFTKDEFFALCDYADGTYDNDLSSPNRLPKTGNYSEIERYAEAIKYVHDAHKRFGARAVTAAILDSKENSPNPPEDKNEEPKNEPGNQHEPEPSSEPQPVPESEPEQESDDEESRSGNKYRLKPEKPDNKYRLKPEKPDNKYRLKPLPQGQGTKGSGEEYSQAPMSDEQTPEFQKPTEPKGDLPLPENKEEFKSDNPLQGYDALTVGAVNQDKDLEAKSIYEGESRLASELNEGKGIRKVLKKVFKGGLLKNYYRQKYINEARHDMRLAQNIVLDFGEDERRRYNRGICKTFLSEEEGVIDEEAGDRRKSLLAENPEMHAKVQDIVARYASGEIKTPEEASREFKQIIRDLEEGAFSGDNGHLSVNNITDVAIEAKRRYNALMTISESMNGKLTHDEAVARVMAGFDVKYGERRIDRLDPHYNKVDAVVNKIQSSKIGVLVSPETTALAVGAAACAVEAIGRRIPSLLVGGLPGVSGAIAGGMRASADFEKDRSRALYDERYSREFDGNQKERESMMKTLHEHHAANDVRSDIEARIQAINEARGKGEDVSAMQKELLQAVARCKTYLNFEKTDHSVLSYSSEVEAPEEQLLLLQQMGAAKRLLKEIGTDVDKELDNTSDLMTQTIEAVDDNLKDSEKLKRKAKVARIAKRAGISFASGLIVGVGVQEVRALFDPNVQGIFESGTGAYGARLTATKKLALAITGKDKLSPDMSGHYELASGTLSENSKQLDFVQAKDGTYNIVDTHGKTVATGLDWNAKTGEMTPASIKALEAQGIKVSSPSKLTQVIGKDIKTTSTKNVSLDEYLEKTTDKVPKVHREYWYDNNTKVFDQNELRCYYHTDASGNHGLITGMSDSGSYHADKVANFSSLAKNGDIKLMISPTADTQGTPIEVTGKLLSNGQVSFCPEPGTAAAQFFDADGKFIGKYAEIVQDLGTNASGESVIAPLSTVVGDGFDGTLPVIEEDILHIDTPVNVPEYLFQFPNNEWDMPFMFPLSAAGAMNSSKHAEVREREVPYNYNNIGYGYGYNGRGYGENGEAQAGNEMGEVSPRIAEGKKLSLGQEVSWYVDDQLRNKTDSDYYSKVERGYESSEELKSLNNNIKTIVTIPVHAPSESENIYRTLSLYANQEDVDPNSYMVLLDVNWRGENEKGDPAEVAARIQATRDRIAQARRDFPNLKIATVEQPEHGGIHDVAHFMNDSAMMAINHAVKDGRMSADNDVIIIRNDADVKHMSKHYVASYQETARENPKTPLFTGTTWFDIGRQNEAPGFAGTQVIERIISIYGALDGEIYTEGRNFAYRASHFAATNCFGFEADNAQGWVGAGSDDVRVGFRVQNAFRNVYANRVDKEANPNSDDIMDPTTQMMVRTKDSTIDTDDNRQLRFYEAGRAKRANVATADVYSPSGVFGGYNQNAIRPGEIKNFVEDMTDRQRFNDTADQFEREVERYYSWGMNPRDPRMRNILSWFFAVDDSELDNLYTVEPYPDGRRMLKFSFTEDGRARLREALVARFGDGLSTDVRNSLQEAIASGRWAAPAANPAA